VLFEQQAAVIIDEPLARRVVGVARGLPAAQPKSIIVRQASPIDGHAEQLFVAMDGPAARHLDVKCEVLLGCYEHGS
jgi:hypothetical protein